MNYSDEQKQWALDKLNANGGNVTRTSEDTGIAQSTLRRWRDAARPPMQRPPPNECAPETSDAPLDEQWEVLAQQLIDVMPHKFQGANLQQIVGALKLVLDQMGRAEKETSPGDAREKLARLLDRYAAERAASGAEPDDE